MMNEDDMNPEYDLSPGERGKHYVPDAVFRVPVYLEQDVTVYLSERAEEKGVTVTQLVNELLRRDIELIESLK